MTAPLTLNAPDLRRARTLLFWLLIAAEAEPVAVERCACHLDLGCVLHDRAVVV
jgi:hypothetical protein